MEQELFVYNTLSRKKEKFIPLNPPFAGMYVCGPTVYGDPHLGHARPGITFDLIFRYLKHLGYKVRYVRNITDVGHLENDADQGEDKIAKKARLEQLEPMEVAQYYSDRYHRFMQLLNVLPPSIEPRASGHIIEQIELIRKILDAGFAYEANGSVYFDVKAYNGRFHYGKLSGRVVDDLISNTRTLEGQEEKKNPNDFALWKKALPSHIMRWPSPWSEGFPGWHLECSAMSSKYLGETFDIHGGGMDLLFPHHESEIAQSQAACGHEPCRYWIHNNIITINGQKMGKSLNNFITLEEFFTGTHASLTQAYGPMTIRFFILQAHYRGTLDFSNEALQAAEKALKRLLTGYRMLNRLKPSAESDAAIHSFASSFAQNCTNAMNDDFNSPVVIAALFEALSHIHLLKEGREKADEKTVAEISNTYRLYLNDILGISDDGDNSSQSVTSELMTLIIELRKKARANKDFESSDMIRDALKELNISLKDTRDGTDWEMDAG